MTSGYDDSMPCDLIRVRSHHHRAYEDSKESTR
jgi:hypothetical protein